PRDWSSDVCSSDLACRASTAMSAAPGCCRARASGAHPEPLALARQHPGAADIAVEARQAIHPEQADARGAAPEELAREAVPVLVDRADQAQPDPEAQPEAGRGGRRQLTEQVLLANHRYRSG